MAKNKKKGVSLAKGPVGLVGIALLAYGLSGLIFGGNHFAAEPVSGTVQGTKWLGLEGNGWTNLLFAGGARCCCSARRCTGAPRRSRSSSDWRWASRR